MAGIFPVFVFSGKMFFQGPERTPDDLPLFPSGLAAGVLELVEEILAGALSHDAMIAQARSGTNRPQPAGKNPLSPLTL
jgi:hypothetical protein